MLETRPEEASQPMPWHESTGVMVLAGIGGLAAIGALVVAVLVTSHHSVVPPAPEGTSTSVPASTTATRRTTPAPVTTTRNVPVTTSEVGAPTQLSPPAEPEVPDQTTSAPTTTTMSNPYLTTTAPIAGAF